MYITVLYIEYLKLDQYQYIVIQAIVNYEYVHRKLWA